MVNVGVAGVPGAWSSERMAAALSDAGAEASVFSLGDCLHDLTSGCVSLKGADLARLDAIVVKKLAAEQKAQARDRLHLVRALRAARRPHLQSIRTPSTARWTATA